jgi:hypothetical protein
MMTNIIDRMGFRCKWICGFFLISKGEVRNRSCKEEEEEEEEEDMCKCMPPRLLTSSED